MALLEITRGDSRPPGRGGTRAFRPGHRPNCRQCPACLRAVSLVEDTFGGRILAPHPCRCPDCGEEVADDILPHRCA